jgi:hypothetical protein
VRRIAYAFAAVLATGGAAFAAEGAAKAPKPLCEDFAKMKAEFAKDKDLADTKFTPLTVGQFHFLVGVYAASPITPPGMPPGDGAQLMQLKDKSSIVWTRGEDACLSLIALGPEDASGHAPVSYMPMPLTATLLKMLNSIKTGIDETAVHADDGDLHL